MRKRILAIVMAFALFVVMGPVDMFVFAADEEAAEDTKVEMQSEEAGAESGEGEAAVEEETDILPDEAEWLAMDIFSLVVKDNVMYVSSQTGAPVNGDYFNFKITLG